MSMANPHKLASKSVGPLVAEVDVGIAKFIARTDLPLVPGGPIFSVVVEGHVVSSVGEAMMMIIGAGDGGGATTVGIGTGVDMDFFTTVAS
jgi:hypothetical protein